MMTKGTPEKVKVRGLVGVLAGKTVITFENHEEAWLWAMAQTGVCSVKLGK